MNEEHTLDESQIKFKNLDEYLRFKIGEYLDSANKYRINGELEKSFYSLLGIFDLIKPKNFKYKQLLTDYTENIEQYINNLGGKPLDMRHNIQIQNDKFELRFLIKKYFELIPYCLDELGLYLKTIRSNDDPDSEFSEHTFGTESKRVDSEKEELASIDSKELLMFMTPRQIHDVYTRILIEVSLRKKVEEIND